MLYFQWIGETHGGFPRSPELAKHLHSSFASLTQTHLKEVSMLCSSRFRALLLISGFFVATAARAQTQMDEIGSLPATLSTEQLQSLAQLRPVTIPAPPQPRARRQLPKPPLLLSPEELS